MDWTHYLNSIHDKYEYWWTDYTLTTVRSGLTNKKSRNARPRHTFSNLKARSIEEKKDNAPHDQKYQEEFGVLEGLRKYAKDHVLLQGRPGLGKSTALKRLLLEEAASADLIPVLLELKLYEDSITGLIKDFLREHSADLSEREINQFLENGEFLLLIDGVNELPSEKVRRELETFRSRYQKSTSMIFTTRDLGLGGNLGIEKKLEMLPLNESQIREFVCAYLPETGEIMLRKLGDRLRQLGETPLLLGMLCDLYEEHQEIPATLGEVFRDFTEGYENRPELKGKVPLGVSSKSFWGDLLQEIAFRMMQGVDDPKEIAVAIPKSEAVKIIWDFCKGANLPNSLGDARLWLEELLAYHLIELEGRDQITFCHQLIQEYYAAEKLLKLLPELDEWSLKWDYLNYLKWTESIKLMCSFISSQKQAIEIVSYALELDFQLGSTLAGAVSSEFQSSTIQKIIDLDFPENSKIDLLKSSYSETIENYFISLLSNQNASVRSSAAYALKQTKSVKVINRLIQLLDDSDGDVRRNAIIALEKTNSKLAIQKLIATLSDDDPEVPWQAGRALQTIAPEVVETLVIPILSNTDTVLSQHIWAIRALGYIASQSAVEFLLDLLSNENQIIRQYSLQALRVAKVNIGEDRLKRLLFDTYPEAQLYVIQTFILTPENRKEELIKQIFNGLLLCLRKASPIIRGLTAEALGYINSDSAVSALIFLLSDTSPFVRCHAAHSLRKINPEIAVTALKKSLLDVDIDVRKEAELAYKINEFVLYLKINISNLRSPDHHIRLQAVKTLKKMMHNHHILFHAEKTLGKMIRKVEGELIALLSDTNAEVREYVAKVLGDDSSESVIKALNESLSDKDIQVRLQIIESLGKVSGIESKDSIQSLIHCLFDENQDIRKRAMKSLENIGSSSAVYGVTSSQHENKSKSVYTALFENIFYGEEVENAYAKIRKEKQILYLSSTLTSAQSKLKLYRVVPSTLSCMTNYLIITALVEEFNAIKNCLDGWLEGTDQEGFPFSQTKIGDKAITIARSVQMGETHTANLATRLISELKPKAIFMTGICAGNPDKVKLGDVIVASKVFKVDAGKQTPEGFFHDVTTYNLKLQWLHQLQDLTQDTSWHKNIQTPRPKTYAHQKGWLLHTLHDHRWKPDLCLPPQNHPEREHHCPDWQAVIQELVADELITLSPLNLTPKAITLIDENRILHLDTGFLHDSECPKVHIGAMATTSSVQEDPELFDRIKKYAGQRNILGVEMEGAAIGAVAEITGISMLVVKAVQDYGDSHKSDQFRAYAAEASTRFLLTFLETIDLESI